MSMPILAAGFDIDGTLYAEHKLYKKLFFKAMPKFRLLHAFNSVRHELRELLLTDEYNLKKFNNIEEFHNFQAELVAKRLDRETLSVYNEIEDFFYTEAVKPFSSIPLYKGVKELLLNLKSKGLKLGALSDFPCTEKIKLMGLDGIFDVIMTSEETGRVKPDPGSFVLFAKRMGILPEEILFIGNSERYDIVGSLSAGMRAAKISKSTKPSAAEFVFSEYSELEKYINKIMQEY